MKRLFVPSAFFAILFYFVFANAVHANHTPSTPYADGDSRIWQKDPSHHLGNPDFMAAPLGHCQDTTIAVINCVTHTIELSAYVYWVFTGQFEPIVATWSTGQVAHKITVTPPGVWSWDPLPTGCEPYHWHTEYKQPGSFFLGNIDIQGPASLCDGDLAELSVESGGYSFQNYHWAPNNPGVNIPTYQISAAGSYSLTVTDDMGCPFSDQITIAPSTIVSQTANISLCTGDSVTIGGQVYTQSGTVIDTIPSNTSGCDTIITYTITQGPFQIRSVSISFCPGESVTIDGQVYTQSGTVMDTLLSATSCDTIVTYTLTLQPFHTRSETISFCPSQIITLGGTNYTQPGTVVLTLPANSGCDTIVTYTLQFLTPAASNLSVICPSPISVMAPFGSTGAIVNYNQPTAATDCPCPGIALTLSGGLASGSHFPKGVTPVCFQAKDSCGQSASCCFNVTVEEAGEVACDTKISGCMKYELLTVAVDAAGNRTYRVRVTNNCSNKLIYTAFEMPNGTIAVEPANFSIYTAPSGNTYQVRNPSNTPLYSIRFASKSDSIHSGESDIFKYTLPKQSNAVFIHVLSRLESNVYLEAILNTFECMTSIPPINNQSNEARDEEAILGKPGEAALILFPNPASQHVTASFGKQTGELQVIDQTGRVVLRQWVGESDAEFSVADLPQGLYRVIFIGEKTMLQSPLAVQR